MVTFKESFHIGNIRSNNHLIISNNNTLICKLMYDNSTSRRFDTYRIYILSTTENPFLFTFKTI